MNTNFNRLVLLAGMTGILAMQVKAGTINDPVIALVGAPPQQQTVKVSVTISGAPNGTALYYTTDGTNPSMSSPTIASGGTLLLAQNVTLQVEAFENATTTSNIVTEKYTLAGQVSAGTAHTLILRNDGTVWATGDNSAGELGNGTNSNSSTPVQVMINSTTLLTGVVAIAADNNESFAVDGSGKAWAWGLNTNSQLGIGTSSNALYATQVPSLSNIVNIASSQNHTLAVSAGGSVYGWGANTYGQVGNGAISNWVTTPTQVLAPSGQSGYLTGIVAVSAGASHSLALTNGGTVYSWGSNASGQLANGDTGLQSQSYPVQVLQSGAAAANIVGIAAGPSNSFFLRNDGTAWSAGDDGLGELGQGIVSSFPPNLNVGAKQVQGLSGISLVSLSNQCALDSTGMLWTWGDNTTGKLGVGITGYFSSYPLQVTLGTQATPTLTATAGNGQTFTDGSYSAPFQITATSGGTALPNTWVNFVVNPADGLLSYTTTGAVLSPILGGYTNSSGQFSFYLDAESNYAGTVPLTAISGSTQISLSATELASQVAMTGEPTMPQALVVVLGASLLLIAFRRQTHTTA